MPFKSSIVFPTFVASNVSVATTMVPLHEGVGYSAETAIQYRPCVALKSFSRPGAASNIFSPQISGT